MNSKVNFDGVTSSNWKDLPCNEVVTDIFERTLWKGDNGKRAIILEFKADAKFPGIEIHEKGTEQIYVISGIFNDGRENHSEGAFINNPIGSAHIPQSAEGCVVLVIYPEG
ncbi:MAG: cupin domain-containing protein [Methylococcaceae bacterium]